MQIGRSFSLGAPAYPLLVPGEAHAFTASEASVRSSSVPCGLRPLWQLHAPSEALCWRDWQLPQLWQPGHWAAGLQFAQQHPLDHVCALPSKLLSHKTAAAAWLQILLASTRYTGVHCMAVTWLLTMVAETEQSKMYVEQK